MTVHVKIRRMREWKWRVKMVRWLLERIIGLAWFGVVIEVIDAVGEGKEEWNG